MSLRVLYITNEDRVIGGSSLSLETMLACLGDAVQPVLLFRADGPVRQHFAALGYRTLVIKYYRAAFQARGWRRVLRFIPHAIARALTHACCVRRVCRLAGPVDIVHSNSSTVDIGPRIARALGVPHVWHIREYPDLGLGLRFFPSQKAWRRKLLASDAVIAITPGLREHLGLEDAWCIPDAVLPASAVTLQLPKNPEVLFVAGTLAPHKQPEEAIRIFAQAALPEPYRLVLLGHVREFYRRRLTQLAAGLGIGRRVEFRPFVADVRPLLEKASAVLVCTMYEGMGRVAVEAMFAGCPVIARDSGGSHDVLDAGKYGHLYGTVEEGAAALAEVVAAFPESQVSNAGSEAADTYATDRYASRILSIYRGL